MSREGNATGSRVTLHVVSSLDGFIARKDNTVTWMDTNGSAYEAGVSISEEEAATFVKPSTVMSSVLAPMNTLLNSAGRMAILRP